MTDLLHLAVDAAREAGRELVRRQQGLLEIATKSSATDLVTDADRAAEALLVARIQAARPTDAIVGEEGADAAGSSGLRWVIDPLDGTVNYVYGYPGWSVSVACEDGAAVPGEALLGVVFDPIRDECFTALRGTGARMGERSLAVREPVPMERALIATGFSYDAAHRAGQADVVAALLRQVRDVRRGGSAALDLCAVAAGRVDGYYEDSTAHWDWAAGALIAKEAGAVVSALPIAPGLPGREGLVAAGPSLHDPLRTAVTGCPDQYWSG